MIAAPRTLRAVVGVAAACALLLPALPAIAQDVGRLFFTPQQRQELDRRRANNVSDEGPVVESSVTVNGQVTRSSGKTTTWINGVPQYDTYRGKAPDRVAIESGDAAVRVKVGETLERSRGEVKDPLQGGTVRVNPGTTR
jgi:hypothetical protein